MRRRDLIAGFGGLALAPLAARLPSGAPIGAAQEATPAIAMGEGSLAAMLALAPDVLADATPPAAQIATYANPALQLATLGEPPGGQDFSAWANATYWLNFPSGLAEFAREPRWRDTFGFEARQVDQALEVGEPPSRVKLLRGRFDPDELRAAWTAGGYAPVDQSGAEAFSWAAEPDLDFESDVSQLGVGSMNNAAILPDGTLLFAGYLTELEAAVAAAGGAAPNLSARPEIADIAALLDPAWATGYLLTPDAVRVPSVEDRFAGAAARTMPRPDLVAIGATAGGPWPQPTADEATPRPLPPGTPQSATEIALLFSDQAATDAAAAIVEARLSEASTTYEGIPYREFFPTWELRLDAALPALIIRLDASPGDRPGRVFDMLERSDLLFFAWDE